MKKVKRMIILTLLAIVVLALLRQIHFSKAELKGEMPIVFVEPQSASAAVGTNFTVSVKIFNLTDSYYKTDVRWSLGEALPPPGSRYNYSLGNMYRFDISLSWNSTILEYVERTVMTPVEEYPKGVLYGPVWQIEENIDPTLGTYSVAYFSEFGILSFNCPEKNATFFKMTFRVKSEGESFFDLEQVELRVDPNLASTYGLEEVIPIQVLNGDFTSAEMTRVVGMNVGVLLNEQLLTPVILGENATVRILVANDGTIMDLYNLTLVIGTTSLKTWEDQNLTLKEMKAYNYTLETEGFELGRHFLTAEAKILHGETAVVDAFTAEFTVVAAPLLSITISPTEVYVNATVTISAENSFFPEPNSQIVNYNWILYPPGSVFPVYYEGEKKNYTFAESGTWRIMLIVEDNWGITRELSRNATEPYSKTMLLEVHAGSPPPPPPPPDPFVTLEHTIIIAVCSIVIIGIGITIYRFRKKP